MNGKVTIWLYIKSYPHIMDILLVSRHEESLGRIIWSFIIYETIYVQCGSMLFLQIMAVKFWPFQSASMQCRCNSLSATPTLGVCTLYSYNTQPMYNHSYPIFRCGISRTRGGKRWIRKEPEQCFRFRKLLGIARNVKRDDGVMIWSTTMSACFEWYRDRVCREYEVAFR